MAEDLPIRVSVYERERWQRVADEYGLTVERLLSKAVWAFEREEEREERERKRREEHGNRPGTWDRAYHEDLSQRTAQLAAAAVVDRLVAMHAFRLAEGADMAEARYEEQRRWEGADGPTPG